MQGFQVVPGKETITGVQIQWSSWDDSSPAEIFLWIDPTEDGDPHDALVALSAGVIVEQGFGIQFPVYDYAFGSELTLPVGSWFFVGAGTYAPVSGSPIVWMGVDSTAPISQQAWGVNFEGQHSGGDLSGGSFFHILNGDYIIRATARAIPEPSSLVLVTMAMLPIALRALGKGRRRAH